MKGMEGILRDLADVDDVREHLREKLALRKVLEISEEEFLDMGEEATENRHRTYKF